MPVWCEMVADPRRRWPCFAKVVGDERGVPARVRRAGERWGRYSFVGTASVWRRSTARAVTVEATGRLGLAPLGPRDPRRHRGPGGPLPVAGSARLAAAARRARRVPRLRRRARGRAAAGSSARRRPRAPRRRPVGHRPVRRPTTTGASGSRSSTTWSSEARRRPSRPSTSVDGCLRRTPCPARRAGGRLRQPDPSTSRLLVAARAPRPSSADGSRRTMTSATTRQPSRRPRSTSSPATSSRSCWRSASTSSSDAEPFDVYRVAAPGQPEPVHVLPAVPRADRRRLVARADGAAARRRGDLAADRRDPARGAQRASTTVAWRASCPSTPRSAPSTSCWSTWRATTSAGSCASGPSRSTS